MKFKSMFWIYNIIVIFVLLSFTLISLFVFGSIYIVEYWSRMWVVTAIFVVLVGLLDYYFILNWKLFDLMEKEDWPVLLAWLEDKIYRKGKIKKHYVNLLINTALSVSNLESVRKLETEIRHRKKELLPKVGVSLGIPLLLKQNHRAIYDYYTQFAEDEKTSMREWAQWCQAYASEDPMYAVLFELLNSQDPSISLLSMDLLEQNSGELDEQDIRKIDEFKRSIHSKLAGSKGVRILQESRERSLIANVMSSRVDTVRDKLINQ